MTKFDRIRNWTQKIRFKIIQMLLTSWRFLTDKIGIRRDPPESLRIPPENTRVLVHRDSAAEPQDPVVHTDAPRKVDPGSEWEFKSQADIDFGRLDDLEAFADEMTVPKETIERWVAAGILSPVEIRVAERLIKIMREKDRKGGS